jgi:hypothetical protein
VGHALRSDSLLQLKASHARVFVSGLKTVGGTTAGGARGIIAEVMWSSSRRQMGRCNGLHHTLLHLLCCFLCIRP